MNQSLSISAMDGSFELLPIFLARSSRKIVLSGYWTFVIELSNLVLASPATCCITPKSSLSAPKRSFRVSCRSLLTASFASNNASSSELLISSLTFVVSASANICSCWSLFCLNSVSLC